MPPLPLPLTLQTILDRPLTVVTAENNDANLIEIYNHLRSFESDYDGAQSTLRTIASAWILAAIGAVGLVIQAESSIAPSLNHEIAAPMRQALLFVAALGLASLWYLDQRVYQRLLHSVYSLGCHLELMTDKLLPIRSRAYLLNFDITHHLGWFYRAPLFVLLGAAIVSVLQAMFGLHATVDALLNGHLPVRHPPQLWSLAAVITTLHILFFLWIWNQTKKWPSLDEQLPAALVTARRQQQQPAVAAPRAPAAQA
jgi:hypothetical protein